MSSFSHCTVATIVKAEVFAVKLWALAAAAAARSPPVSQLRAAAASTNPPSAGTKPASFPPFLPFKSRRLACLQRHALSAARTVQS